MTTIEVFYLEDWVDLWDSAKYTGELWEFTKEMINLDKRFGPMGKGGVRAGFSFENRDILVVIRIDNEGYVVSKVAYICEKGEKRSDLKRDVLEILDALAQEEFYSIDEPEEGAEE